MRIFYSTKVNHHHTPPVLHKMLTRSSESQASARDNRLYGADLKTTHLRKYKSPGVTPGFALRNAS